MTPDERKTTVLKQIGISLKSIDKSLKELTRLKKLELMSNDTVIWEEEENGGDEQQQE